ncbi:MAG TPA: patatin-like phospholipase family protein [Candidatus Obscuribacterales bacterium]
MTFRILSFDGGGIRGVMSAVMLKAVEQMLDKPLNQHFDLIAGTSTGSILAASVATGLKSQNIIELYKQKGQIIFPYTSLFSIQRLGLVRQFGLSAPKYSNSGLVNVLKDQLRDQKLSEIESTKLLIVSYDTISRNPIMFKSWRKDKPWTNIPLWEACLCSAAAPSYFPAHLLRCIVEGKSQGGTLNTITLAEDASWTADDYIKQRIDIIAGAGSGQTRTIISYDADSRVAKVDSPWNTVPDNTSIYRVLVEYSAIDGGVGANNPTACAVAEGIRLSRKSPTKRSGNELLEQPKVADLFEDISVLSIGTGSANRPIPWHQVRGWGLIQWGWKGRLIDVVFDAPSDIHDYITKQMMSIPGVADETSPRYLRLQPQILNDYMDDATPQNVAKLIQEAEDYIQANQNLIRKFLENS